MINTGTTIVTFLMVFLIQRAQNKDALAIQLKLNELVAAMAGASNRLIDVEDLSEEELKTLHRFYRKLAEMAKKDGRVLLGHLCQLAVEAMQGLQLVFAQVFDVDEPVAGAGHGGDQLVELQLNRQRVLVLGALDQEHHQERDDRRARVDHELPAVGKAKQRTAWRPRSRSLQTPWQMPWCRPLPASPPPRTVSML